MITIQKKICLLGDFAVGKTSLIRRFVESRFDDKYLSTIGVSISRKSIEYPLGFLNLYIWDLAGGDDFSYSYQPSYLRGLSGALVVCDLSRAETFQSLERYTAQIRTIDSNAPIILIANKLDLKSTWVVSLNELGNLSATLGVSWIGASAKTGENVEEAFAELANQLDVRF